MNIIGIVITASSIIATAAYFYNENKQKNQAIHPYDDYPIIMAAADDYKKEKGDYCKDFKGLAPYIDHFNDLPLKRYGLSLDGKFLTITGMPADEAKKIINEIGGSSYINSEVVYLTLMRKNELSDVKPIAHFKMIPDREITTTSAIKYDTSECVAEDDEITEKKWENKQVTFKEPGMYTIKLSIKDKNGNWSDPYMKEIKVIEESGIGAIDACCESLFVLYRNGKVIARGENAYGELGLGNVNPVYDLTYHSMHDCVKQVVCGEHFCLYLLNDGSVFAAGQNQDGQLGTGDTESHRTLNKVWGLENIKQIAAGKHFSAALDYSGLVYVWGSNSEGQLMKDDLSDSFMPVRLEGVDQVKAIACGENFGLALRIDGSVMGWGDNTHGQLGLGYKGKISEPMLTEFKNIKAVYCGEKFALCLNKQGKVYGAGQNNFGQLGIKGKSTILFPEEILKIKQVEYLSVKASLVLAVTQMGKGFVWGNFNAPGVKPITEPHEIPGIKYIQQVGNSGKKCYVLDDQSHLHVVNDLNGKYEYIELQSSFYDFMDKAEG